MNPDLPEQDENFSEDEMRILEQSGMTWPAYWDLVRARRIIDAVNWRLEQANSPLRWGVLLSSDPRRVVTMQAAP